MEDYKIVQYNIKYTEEIQKLWNDEVGYIFPLDDEMIRQNITNSKYYREDCSFVAIIDNKVVGFIIGKIYDNNEIILKYCHKGWISLFYVGQKYRRRGIGSILLDNLEKNMNKNEIIDLSIGSDMDNFFPGIPNDFDNLTDSFFRSKGYDVGGYTHDLIKEISVKDKIEIPKIIYHLNNNQDEEIKIRYATENDKEETLLFLKKCFYGRWYYECLEYFQNKEIKKEYLIATYKNKVVGFLRVNNQLIRKISYNIMWRKRFKKLVGFGPLGVDPDFRKHGIAKALILYALDDGYRNGYSNALIDWTGLVTLYQKYGFEVWKCYRYCTKTLK